MTSAPMADLAEMAPAMPDRDAAEALLLEEAASLDEQRFDDWIALYAEDAVYWVPSWKDYQTPASDPQSELSLIYYAGRKRLEERIWRLRSGQSPASVPLSRTLHSVTNIRLDPLARNAVESNLVVHTFNPRRREVGINFARCRHELRWSDGAWRIAAKKILLLNDYLPASIDVYTI